MDEDGSNKKTKKEYTSYKLKLGLQSIFNYFALLSKWFKSQVFKCRKLK